MGWTFNCDPSRLKDFLQERAFGWDNTDAETGERHVTTCLAHKYVMHNPGSGVFWKVMESTRYTKWGAVVAGPERWIAIDLVKCHNRCWGYKDMEESSGPGDTSCPMKYLEMVPDPLPCKSQPECGKQGYGDAACKCGGCHGCSRCWSRAWRSRVRSRHALEKRQRDFFKSLKVGDIVVIAKGYTIASGNQYTIGGLDPLVTSNGLRIRPKHIDVDESLLQIGIDKEAA